MAVDYKKEYKELDLPKDEPSMTDTELYKRLADLTRSKELWAENIPYVVSLLENRSPRIMAKALWLLGEMGLRYPEEIVGTVGRIASFIDSQDDLLRERALNALGRIGRARFDVIEPWLEKIFGLAADSNPRVRLAFIWASENIAHNTPDIYGDYMSVFEELLHDNDDKVRMEVPEIFRVLGKRRPEFVAPYISHLLDMAETDSNRVVRIHCHGAARANGK